MEADATAARYQHKRTKSGAESYLDGIDHLAHISIKTESSDFDIKPDVSKIRLTSSNPVYTKATKLEPGNSGLRLNEDAVRTIKQEVIKIKQEPVDIDMNSMEVDNCDTDSFHLNGTNYMSDGVEEATFREELRAFVLEKLRTLHCITIAALKCQLHYKLAESPPGHILSRGITDKLLEQTILDIGGKVVNSSVSNFEKI